MTPPVTSQSEHEPRTSTAVLLLGIAVGPIAWFAHLSLTYLLTTIHDISGLAHLKLWLHVVTLAALALVALAGLGSWRAWQATRDGVNASARRENAAFLALSGVLLCALFALVILVGDFGPLMLGAGE